MAKLTDREKARMDRTVVNYFNSLETIIEKSTLGELSERIFGVTINSSSMKASLVRCEIVFVEYEAVDGGAKKFDLYPSSTVVYNIGQRTQWTKVRNIVNLISKEKIVAQYDYLTKSATLISGAFFHKGSATASDIKRAFDGVPEWTLSYPHLVGDTFGAICSISNTNLPKDCPKGYVNWLTSHDKTINCYSLELFEKCNTYGEEYYFLYCSDYIRNGNIDTILTKIGYKNLVKLIKNDVSKMLLPQYRDIERFCDYYEKSINPIIDTNRGLQYNTKLLKKMAEAEENKKLALQLVKLNFLAEKYNCGDYVVIVPQNLEDLQNEGRQQNNCVGHYYNDSVIRGKNLIYFIRKASDPTKSYITCRYNIRDGKTVEYRAKNNCSVNDSVMIELIREIDGVIKVALK